MLSFRSWPLVIKVVALLTGSALAGSLLMRAHAANAAGALTPFADCVDVMVASWSHPAKKILMRQETEIVAVQLCRDRKYPVFHVRAKFDPRTGATSKFYAQWYRDLAAANGFWSYAVIFEGEDLIALVDTDRTSKSVSVSYQETR